MRNCSVKPNCNCAVSWCSIKEIASRAVAAQAFKHWTSRRWHCRCSKGSTRLIRAIRAPIS